MIRSSWIWQMVRRLIVGDNEIPEEELTGRELQRFFLELLEDKNLVAYHKDRQLYIGPRALSTNKGGGYLRDEAERLLREGRMHDIEDEILKVTGSSKAVPLFVVSPPY